MNDNLIPWFVKEEFPEQIYTTKDYLVLDFETDNLDFGSALNPDNDLFCACWLIVRGGVVVEKKQIIGGIYDYSELLEDIASVDFIVAQNLKFELQWLKRCGLELRDVLGYDTMLAAWVIDGNRKRARDLNSLAKRYKIKGKLDIVSVLIKLGVNVRDINPDWVLEYCHQDVATTLGVFLGQQAELTVRKQWHLAHVRNLTCSVLADIEFEGLTLDKDRVLEEYNKAVEVVERLGAELAVVTGGINLGSPKQVAVFLYETLRFDEVVDHRGKPVRTGKDAKATAAPVLMKLKATTEQQREFLRVYKEYNKQASLLEKNLQYFQLTCEQRDCTFYGNIKQGVVQTGRLASSGIAILFKGLKKAKSVQLQNIPRQFKRLFWSGFEDWDIGEYDSAQLEFRVAVDMAKDKVGTEEIVSGVDVHTFTAQVLDANRDPEISSLPTAKAKRQESKKHTFKPLYGGGSGSDAVVAYCNYFKDKYKDISEMQRTWALKCVDKQQFTTPYGMRFYFPGTKMQARGYIKNTTSIYNFPVQGFATGEIIPIALVYFWHRLRNTQARIFGTIHDSIVVRQHKDAKEEVAAIAQQALTLDVYEFLSRVYKYEFSLPLGLGAKVSKYWSDTDEEIKMDVFPDGRVEDRT